MNIDIKTQVAELNKRSYSQLKKELNSCNNPVRNKIIRKLLERRDNKKKIVKKAFESNKYDESDIDNLINKLKGLNFNLDSDDEIVVLEESDSDIDYIKENLQDENIDELLSEATSDPNSGEDYQKKFFNKKFRGEIERDHVNNQLMDRLSSDIYIRTFKANTTKDKKKIFVSPFSDAPDPKYAPFAVNK